MAGHLQGQIELVGDTGGVVVEGLDHSICLKGRLIERDGQTILTEAKLVHDRRPLYLSLIGLGSLLAWHLRPSRRRQGRRSDQADQ